MPKRVRQSINRPNKTSSYEKSPALRSSSQVVLLGRSPRRLFECWCDQCLGYAANDPGEPDPDDDPGEPDPDDDPGEPYPDDVQGHAERDAAIRSAQPEDLRWGKRSGFERHPADFRPPRGRR